MKILYITKLKNTLANGVTVAVSQLLNTMCKYVDVCWLNFGIVDIEIDERVKRCTVLNWQNFNPDIAVFEDPFNTLNFCKVANKLTREGVPYILSPHGCFSYVALQKKALKKRIAVKTVLKRYLKGCVATQFLCKNEMDNSIQFNKSIIIPNGIPYSANYQVKQKIKTIVFISRKDVRHKGIDYLLEAIKKIKSVIEEYGVTIHLYGSIESDNDERLIERYIDENDLQSIVFNHGAIFGKEKESVLMNSDLFILTSRHEGFPMSILEALSYGLPVLITNGTNMDDIVVDSDAGWTCKTDSSDIADALLAAINSSDCEKKSKNARAVAMNYSWDEISKETVKEYDKILKMIRR